MKSQLAIVVLGVMLIASACSAAEPDATETTASPGSTSELAATTTQGAAQQDQGDSESSDDAADSSGEASNPGGATATLTLENGESFTFGILCALEPQEAAGQNIEFVVVSYDNPHNLDVTQFAPDSFGGAANISVYDSSNYDTVWEANSFYGGEIELSLAGRTVTGQGMFVAEGDPTNPGVAGQLIANC